ncbi:MAG: dTMP kinase [Hyphomicrobiaceae bacterium]
MTRGTFITFEGGEGSGKSTQARLLAATLEARGIATVLTREPGGTPRAERIRDILLDHTLPPGGALHEALLFNAARVDHLDALVRPALARGAWVICDRFLDSTRAYQGAAGTLPPSTLATLESLVVGPDLPDLTFVMDLDPVAGLRRARNRNTQATPSHSAPDAFESRDLAFHTRLRAAYLAITAAEPARCRLIDAAQPPDVVASLVAAAVEPLIRRGRG